MEKCITCNKKSVDSVKFPCPNCQKEVMRCNKCRSLSAEYKCECGQIGP